MGSRKAAEIQDLLVGLHQDGYLTYNLYLKLENDGNTYVVGGYDDCVDFLKYLLTTTNVDTTHQLRGRVIAVLIETRETGVNIVSIGSILGHDYYHFLDSRHLPVTAILECEVNHD
jgi:hypothetical protein